MFLKNPKYAGLSALIVSLALLTMLCSQLHSPVELPVPHFAHFSQSLVSMMTVGIMLAGGTLCMGIALGIISLFAPSTYKRKQKESTES